MWDIPHTEDNSDAGFTLTWRCQIITLVETFIQKRLQSVSGLYAHFMLFLCRSQRGYDRMCLGIFMRVSLIGLSPRRASLVWAYSDCLPVDRSGKYRVFKFVLLLSVTVPSLLKCFIVCLCVHILTATSNHRSMHSKMGLTPLGGDHKPPYKHFSHSTVGFSPLGVQLCCRDFPLLEPRQRSSADGIFPARKQTRTQLCSRDFSYWRNYLQLP